MVELTNEDLAIIAKHPLKGAFDHLQDVLQKTKKSFTPSPKDEYSTPIQETPRLLYGTIIQILGILINHEVSVNITLESGNCNVSTELQDINKKLSRDGPFKEFFPLLNLALIKANDIDIWTAILNLIETFSTPSKITPSDGTLITRSSASSQDDEPTKRLLEGIIFLEFKNCTYRRVGGFFRKYFQEKAWSKSIYSAVEKRRLKGRIDLPKSTTQEGFWEWLYGFQKKFLQNTRSSYYASEKSRDFTGAEAKRQIQFFMKRRSDAASTTHNWKDILVIGEHKQSKSDFKFLLIQLSRYMRNIFNAQPTRRFIHGFFLHGTTMELWVFDRSGPYSSGEFDIHEEPEMFIVAIVGYAMMSNEELGLDTFIEHNGEDKLITFTDDTTGKKKEFQLEQNPFFKQRATVCRGTTCYRTSDQETVVKFSWTSDKRPSEAKFLNIARERGVTGLASLLGHHKITSIKEQRSGLEFPAAHNFKKSSPPSSRAPPHFSITQRTSKKRKSTIPDSTENKRPRLTLNQEGVATGLVQDARTVGLYDSGKETFGNRLLGCLVISPAGRALRDFRTIQELVTALRDSIIAHSSLLMKGKILHRDISENNIIITDPKKANGFTGMLIDLDLAKDIGTAQTGARQQAGTVEFMAIQVLRKVDHTYRHDLESFFYVLLWICARRVWEKEFFCKLKDRPEIDHLRGWNSGSFDVIADNKVYRMGGNAFKNLLKEFPPVLDCIKPLCEEIRQILFPPHDGGLFLGTPPGPPEDLYNAIIGAFDKALRSIRRLEKIRNKQ